MSDIPTKQLRRSGTSLTVYIIIVDPEYGTICMLRRKDTGYTDGVWQVPAGPAEDGELPTEAAIREVEEEVGLVCEPGDLEMLHVSFRTKDGQTGNCVDVFFRTFVKPAEMTNRDPDKHTEIAWFKFNQLPENTTPPVREGILQAFCKNPFGEFSSECILMDPLYQGDVERGGMFQSTGDQTKG